MSMFCQQGTKLVILRKADAINEYQLAINEMLNADITYIDALHSTLARTGNESWMGPFYVYPSNKLRQWAGLSFTRMPVWLRPKYFWYIIRIKTLPFFNSTKTSY